MTLLEVENLRTRFQSSRGTVQAVDGVDLSIHQGQIVGIVGESGSGKTVLAKSIMGLIDDPGEIYDGDIRLNGESLLDKSESELNEIRGGRVSMIFQNPMNSLNPTLTVGEQIAESIRLHQPTGESTNLLMELKRKLFGANKRSASWRNAIRMLETVEIPEPSSRALNHPYQFSGGMRQRALIAMALACEPDLIIADEPTTALDVTIEAQILDELRHIKEEFETAILLITHDLAVVSEICDYVYVMYAGKIVEKAKTDELFDNPQHPYTQALLESVPSVEEPKEHLQSIPGDVPDLIDMPTACRFAPRCPEAKPECYQLDPEFRPVGASGHEAACIERGIKQLEVQE